MIQMFGIALGINHFRKLLLTHSQFSGLPLTCLSDSLHPGGSPSLIKDCLQLVQVFLRNTSHGTGSLAVKITSKALEHVIKMPLFPFPDPSGFRMVVFSVVIMVVVLFFRKGIMGDRELWELGSRRGAKGGRK